MTSKRGQGEGTWRRKPSGSWEYRFRFTNAEGWSERGSVSAPTKAEARAKADTIAKAAKDGQRRVHRTVTLGAWVTDWRDNTLPHTGLRVGTVQQYRSLLTNHVAGTRAANTRLTDLRASTLQTLIGASTLGTSGKRSLYAALTACLEAAVADGLLTTNPMRKAKRPKRTTTAQAEARALTADHVTALREAAADHRHAALVDTALATGLRRGELLALQWSDVDMAAGVIRVRRQVTVHDDDPSEPKTVAGVRDVPLTPALAAVLIDHGATEQTRLARLPHADTGLVFSNRHGRHLDPRTVSRWYADTATRAGLTETGLHALRHTFATDALGKGVPVHVVSKWLGHSDAAVTLRVYAHVLADDMAKWTGVLAGESSPTTSPTLTHDNTNAHAAMTAVPS